MPETAKFVGADDLRAAVAAGHLSEAQAASVAALAHARAGRRGALGTEDEPFEFFKGFAEIFIAIGLVVLLGGISLMLVVLGGPTILVIVPGILAVSTWALARYFTLRRRMNLPSMVLVATFGASVFVSASTLLGRALDMQATFAAGAAIAALATALWFRRFKLPFAMFVIGVLAFIAINAALSGQVSPAYPGALPRWPNGLLPSPHSTLGTILFGFVAFAAAMWFDLRDRYRIGRQSATAFWLHLLAAVALVNTIAGTIYAGGDAGSVTATAAALLGFAVIALIIDRRSLLTAGIAYIAAVIFWVVKGDGQASPRDLAMILIILGTLFTILGTWWTELRAALMRALPDFPGKDHLPPYAEHP